MSEPKDLESQRQKLWCETVVAYTSAGNSTRKEVGINWADHFLKEFDKRFNRPDGA